MGARNAEWCVDYLQAVEPEALAVVDGIEVVVESDLDSMGFNRVAVYGPTRDAVIGYVRSQWGDEDGDWFKEWVTDRVFLAEES